METSLKWLSTSLIRDSASTALTSPQSYPEIDRWRRRFLSVPSVCQLRRLGLQRQLPPPPFCCDCILDINDCQPASPRNGGNKVCCRSQQRRIGGHVTVSQHPVNGVGVLVASSLSGRVPRQLSGWAIHMSAAVIDGDPMHGDIFLGANSCKSPVHVGVAGFKADSGFGDEWGNWIIFL